MSSQPWGLKRWGLKREVQPLTASTNLARANVTPALNHTGSGTLARQPRALIGCCLMHSMGS